MADSFLAQKLGLFVDSAHTEVACHRPFVILLDGHPWSVAIGGPWMWAVRGSSSFAQMKDVTSLVPRLLSAAVTAPEEVDTKRLKEWAGPVPAERTFTTDDRPEGVLFGKVFDLRRLACLLEPIPFAKLTVWDASEIAGVNALGLEARGKWRAILAAVDGEPEEDHPVFDFRPDGAAAFDLMAQLKED
jgi:hypothetical protein